MADDNLGEADDIGLSFSIGPPAAPIPQAELETRWNRTTEKGGGGFSEVDYQSELEEKEGGRDERRATIEDTEKTL